jgi:hypothetical protein
MDSASGRPGRLFDCIVHRGDDATDVSFESDEDDSHPRSLWTAIAFPGSPTPVDDLQSGDLAVQRALGEGNLATLRVVGDDVEARALYDQNGLIRPDTLVFRETDRAWSRGHATAAAFESDAGTPEDVPSVVGSPRRTASEWHRAARAGFLGKLAQRTCRGTGSEVLSAVMVPASEPKDWAKNQKAKLARDEAILQEIVNGNIPRFLWQGTVVTVKFTGKDKKAHTIHYQVMRDYLTVGNTRDHVIVPLIPASAQRIADRFGCILPTRMMVDQIFNAAGVKLNAQRRAYWMQGQTDKKTGKKVPVYDPAKDTTLATHAYDEYLKKPDCQISTAAYLEHDLAIRKQLKDEEGIERGNAMPLIAGHKKDLVIAKDARADRLQAYGWFEVTKKDGTKVGTPLQNFVETLHEPQYVDYSHAARLVAGTMLVDDQEMTAAEVLAHDVYSEGLNTNGPIKSPRVPNVPVP